MNCEMKKIMPEESIDDILKEEGFIWKENSLLYNKRIGTTKQKITMDFISHYATYMLIYPYYSVSFPFINEIVREMTQNDPIFSKNDTIYNPIQHIAKSEDWLLINGKAHKD